MNRFQFVCFSTDPWDEIWRRRQHLMSRFARRPEVESVVFINPPRPLFRSGLSALRTVVSEPEPRVRVVQTWNPAPLQRLGAMRTLGRRAIVPRLRAILGDPGPAKRVLWLYIPFDHELIGRLGDSAAVAELTDDWTQYDQNRAWIQALDGATERLVQKASLTVSVSPGLAEKWRRKAPNPIPIVPNGVDFRRFQQNDVSPEAVHSPGSAIAGYVGTLDNKIDEALLEAILPLMPDVTFRFHGPVFHPPLKDLARRFSNFQLPGPLPHERLPEVLRNCRVLLIPHKVNALTESLHPIKLFEYLATGRPVVSTPVAGVREWEGIVYLAEGPEAFRSALRLALAENDPALSEKRKTAARDNDWDQRVDRLLELMKIFFEPTAVARI